MTENLSLIHTCNRHRDSRTENRDSEPKNGLRQECLLSSFILDLCRNNDDRGDGRCGS